MQSLYSFGIFTDLHYARRRHDGDRWYKNSLKKLSQCLDGLQGGNAAFVVCLGDLVDHVGDEEAGRQELAETLALLQDSGLPFYPVLGNHDADTMPAEQFLRLCGAPDGRGYYSFSRGPIHFVVLDTNYRRDGTPFGNQNFQWNDCYVSQEQLEWLEGDLASGAGSAVIFTHANLDDRFWEGRPDPHVVRNAAQVRRVLEQSGKRVQVFQGHCHFGAETMCNGIPYHTLRAMVCGETGGPFLLVHVLEDGQLLLVPKLCV